MKVSIGMNLQSGPWGGGNRFGCAVAEYLRNTGVDVRFDLASSDTDAVLLMDPRRELTSCAYTDREIMYYLRRVNSRAIVVHRVNECDERKATTGVNRLLRCANLCADHTVFVSEWLRDLHVRQGMRCFPNTVILNGSDRRLFGPAGYQPWDGHGPLRLVTHHWGANRQKGFDIYGRLDRLLGTAQYRGRIAFTYVGNVPEGFRFTNTVLLTPRSGPELADEIRSQHVYLTASEYEPGSNHQNEGASCGLPLLYRLSGSLPEYCEGFGIGFTAGTFEQRLNEMIDSYETWVKRMPAFPHSAERMCRRYAELLRALVDRGDTSVARSRVRRHLWWRLLRGDRCKSMRPLIRWAFERRVLRAVGRGARARNVNAERSVGESS